MNYIDFKIEEQLDSVCKKSSIQVIADACLKNIQGFDQNLAYEAMKATTMLDLRGLKYVKQFGFIPVDSMVESVAMGMEYSISDASIALMAKKRNNASNCVYFSKRGVSRHFSATVFGFNSFLTQYLDREYFYLNLHYIITV